MRTVLISLLISLAICFLTVTALGQKKVAASDRLANDLTDAARRGDLDRVKSILNSGADVNIEPKGFKGWTALMAAATSGRLDVAKFLLAGGASVNVRLDDGETVLIQAAQSDNNREIVELLLNAGVDVNAQTKDGLTALMRFAWMGHLEAVRALLNAEANTKLKNKNGWTAFYFACSHGNNREIVDLLLKHGADVNERDSEGRTPLMWIGWGNRAKNFEALISAGADVNARDKDGTTALMISSSRLFLDEVDLLLNANADVNAKDSKGWTALMRTAASTFRRSEIGAHGDGYIVWLGATRLIEKLVSAGATLNDRNRDGDTALMLAYKNRNAHFAQTLLKLGADASLRNKKGLSAADYGDKVGKSK
ncbi:MAG: ankyrin repeat domain-containing protein [Pyrinomonadaceae bacterium]|nr:ankyrin repeat domain-containing protein [Pyrinomonadaceae bacterium]